MSKNKVIVEINSASYTLVGTETEDYIYRVGVFVDRKIKEIVREFPTISTSDAAVLAAVNIADELLRLRDENAAMDERLSRLIAQSQTKVESSNASHQKASHEKHLNRNKR